ncbi:MAG TPA: GNAT family N-acetyltransferase [Acidimicrobiales bacterium]|nr:GNAT family N-acetyltransferase [Acidimicrobiales bacterium]
MGGPAGRDELAALPLLAGASAEQVERVAECMRPGEAPPGTVLGREGERGDVFWLLLDGRVSISTQTSAGERLLAEAGPGSIIGELALLRHRPRTATVTAMEHCRYLCGQGDAMERLLDIDPVRLRLRRLASSRLAQDVQPVPVLLREGTKVLLRPLLPSDRAALDSALHALSSESIRRRFFSAGTPSQRLVDYLVDIDYVDHFAWAVVDAANGEGVAVARYVREPGTSSAEMAFTTVDRYQRRGVGTFLLGALGVAAREAGLSRLIAYVMEDNSAMRAVFAKAGGHSRYDEPGLVQVDVEPARAAALLDPATDRDIASAVHDVVTAASLALA